MNTNLTKSVSATMQQSLKLPGLGCMNFFYFVYYSINVPLGDKAVVQCTQTNSSTDQSTLYLSIRDTKKAVINFTDYFSRL